MFKVRLTGGILRIFMIFFALFSLTACSSESEKVTGVFVNDSGKKTEFLFTLAQTQAEKKKGLMFTRYLPEREGMLFQYDPPAAAKMWMKDTYIPLDLFFINCDGKIVYIEKNRQPETLDVTDSGVPVCYVAELNGGAANIMDVKAGDHFYLSGFLSGLKRVTGL